MNRFKALLAIALLLFSFSSTLLAADQETPVGTEIQQFIQAVKIASGFIPPDLAAPMPNFRRMDTLVHLLSEQNIFPLPVF